MRLRYLFPFFLAMSLIAQVRAQDVPGSSIVSRTFLSSDGSGKLVQRVYDNGLGDIVQEIRSFQGSALPNIVVSHEYDRYRRRTRDWLPVTTSDSTFVSGSTVSGLAQSQYSDTAPFSRTEYDGFLTVQPSAQYKAGAQWQGNGKKVNQGDGDFDSLDILIFGKKTIGACLNIIFKTGPASKTSQSFKWTEKVYF